MSDHHEWAKWVVGILAIIAVGAGVVAMFIAARLIMIPLAVFSVACLGMTVVAIAGRRS